MPDLTQIGPLPPVASSVCRPNAAPKAVLWLQGITLLWMLVELAVSIYAAVQAHSPVLLAFGSDSLVEVLSAAVVLLQWTPRVSISELCATRIAAVLLFMLAFIVSATALASLILKLRPQTSYAGMGITIAALLAMPVLAFFKRNEARRTGNKALAADAVQSATCAYLALIALAGLSVNALFHITWFDAAAALVSVPLLVHEGRRAWQGHSCGCC